MTDERPVAAPADEVGLGSLARALWRRRLTVAACFAGALACGGGYLLVAPVGYQASATILLDPRLGKTVGADPSTPGFVADSSAIDSQVKLLTSQSVLSRVATTLHLDDDPDFGGKKFSVMRLLGLSTPSPTGADLKALETAITIKRPERTYLVEIQAVASSADKAAAIANAVADAYNEDQISSRVVAARNDAKFVTQKREQLRRQIEDAEKRVEAYKSANRIVSTDGLRSNEQQVADLTRELGASRGRLSDLKARAEQIAAVARSGRADGASEALKSATMERLRGAQADAERELAKLSETLGPRHPARLEAQAQTQRVRDLIAAELKRLREGAENDYQTEKRNEAQLLAELDRVKKTATDSSGKLVPLRQMEREVEALRASDERFARVADTLAQQEGDTPPARLVAAARPPVSPSSPKKVLVMAIATGAGLFVGFGAALMSEGAAVRTRAPAPEREPVRAPARQPAAPSAAPRGWWDDEAAADAPEPRRPTPPPPRRAPPLRTRAEPEEDFDDDDYFRTQRPRRPARRERMVWP